ncbi:hypothetical protein ACUY3K_10600 [Corynebacterium uberis]|uniref:hypothetical protein n=1 Tax=Corynebacterium TaxID=1716 RepID=UPI001D0B55EF|nr:MULTISPECIES: hypothetical protein [Corynebacterium]MCZ9309480.1 hypothetical protein [Corynebacterium sp. c6VSa_13]UDL73030.1 hypothetical protein LH391_07885 [Corynebacterium uberis]UDL76093.1 hypothetical protein LH393_01505 [Corynebacterium uberis]UDL78305.1 hypothetical protein LH394_01500 [Corynebacterium uberis]UDL80588.1 hypothetical protein LH392_01930 [Corynebacterium uberis]
MKFSWKDYRVQILCVLGGLLAGFLIAVLTDAHGVDRNSLLLGGLVAGIIADWVYVAVTRFRRR